MSGRGRQTEMVSSVDCIYCGQRVQETDGVAHIIPQVIGGRYGNSKVCGSCNNYTGTAFEKEFKDSLYFVNGIERFHLSGAKNAFSQTHAEDPITGQPYLHRDGEFKPVYKPVSETKSLGPKEELHRHTINSLRRHNPKDAELYEAQAKLDLPDIIISNGVFEIRKEPPGKLIEVRSKRTFPNGGLAKIVYEIMAEFEFPDPDLFSEFKDTTFEVHRSTNGRAKILLRPSFRYRVNLVDSNILTNTKDYATLDYKPFHHIDFRLTLEDIAYVHLYFFGIVSVIVVLGPTHDPKAVTRGRIGSHIVFPLSGNDTRIEQSYGPEMDAHKRYYDDIAKFQWGVYCEKRSDVSG